MGESSQLVRGNLLDQTLQLIGPVHQDANFEGLTFYQGRLLTSNGNDDNSRLYEISATTDAPILIGTLDAENINTLATRSDGTLWGWSDQGLVQIDVDNATTNLVQQSSKSMNGLAWALDGSAVYGVSGHKLYKITPSAQTIYEITNGLPDATEGLEMLPNGRLLGGTDKGGQYTIFVFDLATREVVSGFINPAFSDIEALAIAPSACNNIAK